MHSGSSQTTPRPSGALIATLAGLIVVFLLDPPLQVSHRVELMPLWVHTVAELWSITIAIMIFSVVWNAETTQRPGRMSILACGFLAVGLIDGAHMLSFRGMPDFVTPASPQKAIDFWLAARAIQALTLFAATFGTWHPLVGRWPRDRLLLATVALVLAICGVTLFKPEMWPTAFVEGKGLTAWKVGAEYCIVLMLLPSAIASYRRLKGTGSQEHADLCTAASISILSEICFTLYVGVDDLFNLLGHLYKIAAFYFFYRAVFRTCVTEPYARVRAEIAERERASRALEYSEQLLRELGANLPELLMVRESHSNRLLYVSPSWMALLGRALSERESVFSLLGTVHPDDRQHVSRAIERYPEGGFEGVVRMVGVEGPVRSIYLRTFPVRDPAGSVYRVVAIGTDITERLRIEQALYESEARLRAAVHVTQLGIFDHDHATDEIYFSLEWRAIHGWSPEEQVTLGRFISSVHDEDRERVALAVQRAHDPAGDGKYEIEYRIVRPDGKVYWLYARSQTEFAGVGEGRRPVRTVGATMDITARHELSSALQELNRELEARVAERTSELQRAHDELESFSYSVSHDLRAPLRHVAGYIDLLEKETAGTLSPDAARFLGVIGVAAKRMGTLIDSLLSFSRIGRTPMRCVPIDMNKLVDDVRTELEHDTAGRKIEWRVGALPVVEVDPNLMRLVWTNLLSNAIKFTAGCECARIEIGYARRDGDHAPPVFYVRDNGAGFDMRYADKLFGVFQRLHRREEFEGTGIGLANCKRIVERHGGRISATANNGGGAEFTFTLGAASGRQA